MKSKFFRMLVCCIIGLLFVAALAACGEKNPEDTENPSDTESTDEIESNSKEFDIFSGKNFSCTFVLPQNATDVEKQVASSLNNAVTKKTGTAFEVAYEGIDNIDASKNLVLIGNTSYEESKNAYKKLEERSASANIVNNKMVLAFNNAASGLSIVDKFAEKIDACEGDEVILSLDWSEKYTALPERSAFVEFPNENLMKTEYKDGSVLYTSYENTAIAFSSYCASLEAAGFKKIDSRVQTSNGKSNYFFTYQGEYDYVYVYFMAQSFVLEYTKSGASFLERKVPVEGIVKVMVSSLDNYAPKDMSSGKSKITNPGIATICNPHADGTGQGYIYVLPDGRLIVQDGGYYEEDFMYTGIRKVAEEFGLDKNNIVIAAWFISHPHGDHQTAFFEFIRGHAEDETITLERVIYNYTTPELYDIESQVESLNGKPLIEGGRTDTETFYSQVRRYIPEVPVLRAHTGQVLNFGLGVTVEILFTVEDIVPEGLANVNNSSMIMRVDMGDSNMLVLADEAHGAEPRLIKMWGDYLKSDMVQISHHGMWSPDNGLYANYVKADVLFMPTDYKNGKDRFDNTSYNAAVLEAYRTAKDMYISDYGVTHIIKLSATGGYTITNNKATEWAKTGATKS